MAGEKKKNDEEREEESVPEPSGSAAPSTEASDEPLSDADLAALREQAAKADEFEENWLRTAADLQNLQRRAARDKDLARRMAVRDLLSALLPCFDNLERAVSSSDEGTPEILLQGVSMVSTEIRRVLSDHGVEVVAPTAGERLDPTRHEAVFSRHDDEVEENLILEVHEKGYALGEVIIRPARVAVSLGVAPVDEEAEENKDPSGD